MPLSSFSAFEPALAHAVSATEQTMDRLLPKGDSDEARVFDAMRYSSLGGGKRLRAFFVLAGATLFKVGAMPALRTASAIEFLHAYSLTLENQQPSGEAVAARLANQEPGRYTAAVSGALG